MCADTNTFSAQGGEHIPQQRATLCGGPGGRKREAQNSLAWLLGQHPHQAGRQALCCCPPALIQFKSRPERATLGISLPAGRAAALGRTLYMLRDSLLLGAQRGTSLATGRAGAAPGKGLQGG